MDPSTLMHRYLLGRANADEVRELDQRLTNDPEFRVRFVKAATLDTGLREIAIERGTEPQSFGVGQSPQFNRNNSHWLVPMALAALAAILLVVIGLQPRVDGTPTIATLVSSEAAAWESTLPTTPGSHLAAGTMNLRAGVATIRFRSGAEVLLEAPAELLLVTPMRGKLASGAAVVDVPESAYGFVLETPDGYAVDYGTRFAVRVDPTKQQSDFELVEGEIAVHQPTTGREIRLVDEGEVATIQDSSFVTGTQEVIDTGMPSSPLIIRVGTNGRSDSVLPNNKRHKFIDREILSVKHHRREKWDYRSFFAFDLSTVNLDSAKEARLRLNLVPSVRGFASRLPEINRFGVYGMTNDAKQNWQIGGTWEDAPAPEDGVLLGTFEIPRSTQRGTFGIANEALLNFVKERSDRSVTFLLIRLTSQIEGNVAGLTHAFASDYHPESVGPLLEFTFDE